MPIQRKPVPPTIPETINKQIHPYPLAGIGNPNVNPNRGDDISTRNDIFKDISITLKNITEAIIYHIINNVKPTVVENGQQIPVPVEYAFGDRWVEVQKNGFLRDKAGRVLLPMIVLKRDNFIKNRNLGNKLDGNNVNLYQTFTTQYTRKNQYDNFSILTGRLPVKQFHLAPVPDYVTITYNGSIQTNNQTQCDSIIQALTFAENSYWGQSDRYRFSATIDQFTDTVEYTQGEDRSIRCDFNITVNAYLLPDNVNQALATQKKVLSKAVIKFTEEIVESNSTVNQPIRKINANGSWLDNNGLYYVDDNGNYFDFGGEIQQWVDNSGNLFTDDKGDIFIS